MTTMRETVDFVKNSSPSLLGGSSALGLAWSIPVLLAVYVGLGVWLGGLLFDRTGSYGLVWWMSVVLGVVAAFLCLPIREERVPRLAVAGAAA